MGQQCNPSGLRIGVIKNWGSKWNAIKEKKKACKVNIPKIKFHYERKIGDTLPIAFCKRVYKSSA